MQNRRGGGGGGRYHRSNGSSGGARGGPARRSTRGGDFNGARPFATRARTRSWERRSDRGPKRKAVAARPLTAEERAAQPIQHVVPVDLSFGNFEFQEMKSLGRRGGGVRELSSLLRQARRKAVNHAELLNTREGAEQRSNDLIAAAMQRAAGEKVKDDATRITKALAKRRSKKRQSAKKWAKRLQGLENSVENVVKDRSIQKQTMRARKEAKVRAKEKKHGVAPGSSSKGGKGGKGGRDGGKGGKGRDGKGAKKQSTAGGKRGKNSGWS